MREMFDAKWRENSETGCHEWTACLLPNGYGAMQVSGKKRSAHRLSWEIHYGKIIDGKHVLHRCDNRKCVNPAHLFLGTHQENMRDRNQKGRQARPGLGELNHMAKLTNDQRSSLIREYMSGDDSVESIANKYGVTVWAIYRATSARYGKHGSRNSRAKLDPQQGEVIRGLNRSGVSINAISRRLMISWPTVNRVIRGESYV